MIDSITPNGRMRARFEAYILRDRGIAFLQRNDPSVDAEHDYADPFIQEAWEAWQGALAGVPSAVHTMVSTQHLRETLGDVSRWLKSALDCKQWDWDPDQRLAAMGCFEEAKVLLGSPDETKTEPDWKSLAMNLATAVQVEGEAIQWGFGVKKARRQLASAFDAITSALKASDLKAPDEPSAVQMTDMEIHADEERGFRAEARFKGDAVKLFAASAVQWFKDNGGENYVTVEMTDSNTHERYSITMQRACGKTPAQELSELRAALKAATTAEPGDERAPTP